MAVRQTGAPDDLVRVNAGIAHRATALDYLDRHSMPDPKSGCTLWTGPVRSERPGRNYGQMYVSTAQPRMLAHRFAYEAFVGPIPPGMHVLHECDNPRCVNPQHLRLGTHQENMADKVRKGRAAGQQPIAQIGTPDELVRVTVKLTRAQVAHLESEMRRLQDRSIAPAARRAVQADMERAQQQRGAS